MPPSCPHAPFSTAFLQRRILGITEERFRRSSQTQLTLVDHTLVINSSKCAVLLELLFIGPTLDRGLQYWYDPRT